MSPVFLLRPDYVTIGIVRIAKNCDSPMVPIFFESIFEQPNRTPHFIPEGRPWTPIPSSHLIMKNIFGPVHPFFVGML